MKNRSLNFKMIFVMAILITGSIVIAGIGINKLEMMNVTLTRIVNENSARVSLIKDIKAVYYLQLINEKNFILEKESKELELISGRMHSRHEELGKKLKDLESISSELGKQEVQKFREVYNVWWTNALEIKEHAMAGSLEKAVDLSTGKGRELRLSGENIIDSTVERNEKSMTAETEAMQASFEQARMLMILTSLIAIFLGCSIGGFVLYRLSKSINEVIEGLSSASAQVAAASQQIASASTELSEATTEQASSLEETVATIEELTSMVKVNASNAGHAAELSNSTSEVANRGEKEMQTLVGSMNGISSDSKKISEIITVIDDIAFQTNLLALNAAVEAARAGEQGKGFAVVAEAVRALSQRSSAAAKDISDLIKSSVHRIEEGSVQAKRSGEVLAEILLSVNKVSQLNQEIATASLEQSHGITQISTAMNQLDQVTQVNAASSEEAAASSEELSAQAESLSNVIVTLVKAIKGAHEKGPQDDNRFSTNNPKKRAVGFKSKAANTLARSSNNHEDLLPMDSAS